ncbi:class F sortase [Streptacidiphilus cavernicola]|uniref:Class F sortase n=1 Tax=Streptacidiphilus cavernicola TaxID=3342716 RepID=A0ABV6W528_9ACTN
MPKPMGALGALSGTLLAVSLGGAVLGLAPAAGARSGPAAHPAAGVVAEAGAARTAKPGPSGRAGAAASVKGHPASDSVPARAASAPTASAAAVAAATAAARPATYPGLARSTPITLALPSIGLTAPLLGLGTDSKGVPELPPFSEPGTAGWLRDSATPGATGTAVLVGHVDTRTGPAVFWNLSAVKPGAAVRVTRLDGSTALFTVDAVRLFARATFPAAQIYAPARDAQLRIITCGGVFDRKRAEYTGNVVLFAHLSGVRPATG